MSYNLTTKSQKISVYTNKGIKAGVLYTSYTGFLFLKKVKQWVEL